MNKEQQIKEIAHIIYDKIEETFGATLKDISEDIYNAGYRKIDDNCAVITKAELKEYKRQAVKEFAEKLKEKAFRGCIDELIEKLLKEYE